MMKRKENIHEKSLFFEEYVLFGMQELSFNAV